MVQGLEPKKWRHREKIADVPQQSNDTDCGQFALKYAECFTKWQLGGRVGCPRLDFGEFGVSQSRKRLSEGFLYQSDIFTVFLLLRSVHRNNGYGLGEIDWRRTSTKKARIFIP